MTVSDTCRAHGGGTSSRAPQGSTAMSTTVAAHLVVFPVLPNTPTRRPQALSTAATQLQHHSSRIAIRRTASLTDPVVRIPVLGVDRLRRDDPSTGIPRALSSAAARLWLASQRTHVIEYTLGVIAPDDR